MAQGDRSGLDMALEKTETAVGDTPPQVGSDDLVVPERRIGERRREERYTIVGEHARGGLGRILNANDTVLGRPVAIKELLGSGGPAELRFQREALITARLQHPSIVPVHDFGRWPTGRPYYAMKMISGRTLKEVVNAATGLRERMALLPHVLDVAEAMAYAHDQRVIHRDLKPSNVIVGEYGETVVVDWGIAKDLDAEDSLDHADDEEVSATDIGLTRVGSVMGTPAYMSPEQADAQAVDERSDVYSLGVILYYALCGKRPFPGEDSDTILAQVRLEKPIPLLEREPNVPSELADIVNQAMARRPEDRYPNGGAFARDLRNFQTGQMVVAHQYSIAERVRRWLRLHAAILAGAAIVGLAGLSAYGLTRDTGTAAPSCEDYAGKLAGVWDEARKGAVRTAFSAGGRAHAGAVYERVEHRLDGYAGAAIAMYGDSCQATKIRGEQSDHVMELRMRCLDRRLAEMSALVEVFAQERPGPELLDNATRAAANLTDLSGCADSAALMSAIPPPEDPELRATVDALQRRLDRAHALGESAQLPEALTIASEVKGLADATGYVPIRARAYYRLAFLRIESGDYGAGTEELYYSVVELASTALEDALVAETMIELMALVGVSQLRPTQAFDMRRWTEAAIARAGNKQSFQISYNKVLGQLYWRRGEFASAQQHLGVALANLEKLVGASHPRVASLCNDMANVLSDQGKHEAAKPYYERALAIWRETLRPDHPDIAIALYNIADLARVRGGSFEDVRAQYQLAMDTWVRSLGADHPSVGLAHYALGYLNLDSERADAALEHFQHSLRIYTDALGPANLDVADCLAGVGDAYRKKNQCDLAVPYFRRALATAEKLDDSASREASARLGLGACDTDRGHPMRGLANLEHAARYYEQQPGDGDELARARFELARALWTIGRDRARARSLAARAVDAYRELGTYRERDARRVDAWLLAHP